MKIEGSGDSLDGALRFKDVGICHSVEEGTLACAKSSDDHKAVLRKLYHL